MRSLILASFACAGCCSLGLAEVWAHRGLVWLGWAWLSGEHKLWGGMGARGPSPSLPGRPTPRQKFWVAASFAKQAMTSAWIVRVRVTGVTFP